MDGTEWASRSSTLGLLIVRNEEGISSGDLMVDPEGGNGRGQCGLSKSDLKQASLDDREREGGGVYNAIRYSIHPTSNRLQSTSS